MEHRFRARAHLGQAWVIAMVLGVQACDPSSDGPTEPRDAPPSVDFTLDVSHGGSICTRDYVFTLDASRSTDDHTSILRLEVRWDLDDDGVWDTEFSREKTYDEYRPDSNPWIVRCEVRDAAGQTAVARRSFDIGPLPAVPDLVAEKIVFQTSGGYLADTVRVGQQLFPMIVYQCTSEFADYRFLLLLDGSPLWDGRAGCSGSLWGCGLFGGGWTAPAVGVYHFTVQLDSDQEYAEANEGNNSASGTLVVIP